MLSSIFDTHLLRKNFFEFQMHLYFIFSCISASLVMLIFIKFVLKFSGENVFLSGMAISNISLFNLILGCHVTFELLTGEGNPW